MYSNNPNFENDFFNGKEEAFDIKAWLRRVSSLWPWFLVTFGISFFLSYLHLRYAKPTYQSTATILIKDEKKGGSSILDNPLLKELNIGGKGSLVENEIEILGSFDMIKEVVINKKLYITTKKKGRIVDYTRFGNEVPFFLEIQNPENIQGYKWRITIKNGILLLETDEGGEGKPVQVGRWLQYKDLRFRFLTNKDFVQPIDNGRPIEKLVYEVFLNSIAFTTDAYKNRLSVQAVGKVGTIISLTLTDLHPEKGTIALNGLIEVYNQKNLKDKNKVNANTIDFLTERLTVLERELEEVEIEVERFKRNNKVNNISSQTQVFLEMVQKIDLLKAEQETKVNTIEALEKELILNKDNPSLVPSTLGIEEPSLNFLIQRHNELILKRDRFIELTGLRNPGLIDLNNQIQDVRINLIENVSNLKASVQKAMDAIKLQDYGFANKLNEIPSIEKKLIQISRDKNVKEQIYYFLLQKKEESAIALAGTVDDSRIIDQPRTLGQISPRKGLVYGIAIGVALILPFLLMTFIDFFDNKVGSRKEIQAKTIAPFLGEISFIKGLKIPLQILPQSRSVVAEQFRGIRTGLSFTGKGSQAKTILITSHRPSEGKSFTCINLGASYALLNKKVLIIEFDLRKPKLKKLLELESEAGISNYLTRNIELDEILLEIPGFEGNFWLLPSGIIPPNPTELILGSKMQKMMDEVAKRFDHILIDSPPFSVVTDATLLQRYADINLIILRQGFTVKDAYDDINQWIQKFPENTFYQILNGIGQSKKYSYYGSKYGYEAKYGYGYI